MKIARCTAPASQVSEKHAIYGSCLGRKCWSGSARSRWRGGQFKIKWEAMVFSPHGTSVPRLKPTPALSFKHRASPLLRSLGNWLLQQSPCGSSSVLLTHFAEPGLYCPLLVNTYSRFSTEALNPSRFTCRSTAGPRKVPPTLGYQDHIIYF